MNKPIYLPNYAGRADVDDDLCNELELAGIKIEKLPESYRKVSGEVKTVVVGILHGWTFKRAWNYWMCDGPGIPIEEATKLYESFGAVVRVAGHAGGPSPHEMFHGLGTGTYHVDTLMGLKALADTIKSVVRRNQ